MTGIKLKYFVLKPRGNDEYARASRAALLQYAHTIRDKNPDLSKDLMDWVRRESDAARDKNVMARGES